VIEYILDSDQLSLYQRGHEAIREHLLAISPDQIGITVITVEELLRGRLAQIRQAAKPPARLSAYYWLRETLDFLCDFAVLEYGAQAEAYFELLQAQKIRIGTQDLRIAAIALSLEATLVTRNRKDFSQVPGLKMTDWSK
jgi:tRNA(fMet)-specific endonuclease VapC